MMLDGKTVVVSGVGPGLGREIAAAAVREGANVAIGARTQANPSWSRAASRSARVWPAVTHRRSRACPCATAGWMMGVAMIPAS